MSNRQAVVLASRVLCVFFLYTALGTLISLPLISPGFLHEREMIRNHALPSTVLPLNTLSFGTALFRLAVDLLLAYFFYQCGPRLTAFLSGEPAVSGSTEISPTA